MGSKIGYPTKTLNLTQLDLDYQEVRLHGWLCKFGPMCLTLCCLFSSAPHRHWPHPFQRHADAEARSVARDPEDVPASHQRKVSRGCYVNVSGCRPASNSRGYCSQCREWLVQPLVVNAFHNPSTNEISTSHCLFDPPFQVIERDFLVLYSFPARNTSRAFLQSRTAKVTYDNVVQSAPITDGILFSQGT